MLALICGAGDLPRVLAAGQPTPPVVYALDGFLPKGLDPTRVFRLEHLGTVLQELQTSGVTEICLAGRITRPAIDPDQIDAATVPLVSRLTQALGQGDDGALRIVLSIFEDAGFTIVSADALVSHLLPPAGIPTQKGPQPTDRLAAQLGLRTIAAMGARDAGQACIVVGDSVLAREDAAGTDAMMQRVARDRRGDGAGWDPLTATTDLVGGLLGSASDWLGGGGGTDAGQGGILVKAPKPTQDRRADLPVIGPTTADNAIAAGLSGIVIEAGGVMVLDLPSVIARLDQAGLFLWVREASG